MTLIILGLLTVLALAAVFLAFYAFLGNRRREEVLERADARRSTPAAPIVLTQQTRSLWARFGEWINARAPVMWRARDGRSDHLTHAGFDEPYAPVVYE